MTDYTAWNDEELIREYRVSQNQQLMAVLFTRYADVGFRTAMRFMKNQADAEDVLQMSYIHFIQNLDLFREGITIRPWLMKMIVNTCKNKLIEEKRRQNRQNKIASARFEKNTVEASTEIVNSDNAELKVKLRQSVDMLPEKYRSPVWLVMFEEISYAEVAEVLGLPEKTIRTQVARGLEKLRQTLSSYGSALSVVAISDLIRNTSLEKAPDSTYELINSPELFKKLNSPIKELTLKSNKVFFSVHKVAIISLALLSVIGGYFLFQKKSESIIVKNEALNPKVVNGQIKEEQNNLPIELDFNKKDLESPYVFMGDYKYLENGGLGNSGCIEISNGLILKIPIDPKQLPIKVTYRANILVANTKNLNGSMITWPSWDKMSLIWDVSKAKNIPYNVNGKYFFEKDEDWEDVTFWITNESIDIWCFGKRMNLYLLDRNDTDNKIYIYFLNKIKLDNMKIESIDKSLLPDVSQYQKIYDEVKQNSTDGVVLIKKYLPALEKENLNPKLEIVPKHSETEVLEFMKSLLKIK